MIKFVAVGVLQTPRCLISMHRILGVYDTMEEAENKINEPSNRFFVDFYIQENYFSETLRVPPDSNVLMPYED